MNNLFWNRFFNSSVLILPVKELNEVLSSKMQTEKLIFTWNKNMKIKQNTDCPNYWKSRLHTYPTKNLWWFFNGLPRWKRKPNFKFKFAFNNNFVINTALDIYTVKYCASLFKIILKTHSFDLFILYMTIFLRTSKQFYKLQKWIIQVVSFVIENYWSEIFLLKKLLLLASSNLVELFLNRKL